MHFYSCIPINCLWTMPDIATAPWAIRDCSGNDKSKKSMSSSRSQQLLAYMKGAAESHFRRLDLHPLGYLEAGDLNLLGEHANELTSIVELSMSLSGHVEDQFSCLCNALTRMPQLKCIEVQAPMRHLDWARELAAVLPSLKHLEAVTVYESRLRGEAARLVGVGLAQLPRLRRLALGFNRMSSDDVAALLAAFSVESIIEEVDLRHNIIHDPTCLIANRLVSKALRTINLSGNDLDDRSADLLAQCAPMLPVLEGLSLRKTQISHDGLLAIMDAILRDPWLQSLRRLDVKETLVGNYDMPAGRRSDDAVAWRELARKVINKNPLSSDAQILLQTLSEIARQAQTARKLEHAWRTRSDWFESAGLDRHRKDAEAVILELINSGMVESRWRGKWQQYRVRLERKQS